MSEISNGAARVSKLDRMFRGLWTQRITDASGIIKKTKQTRVEDVPSEDDRISRFGAFELRHRTAELFRNGRLVPLQGQPGRVLLILVERSGEILSREDLRRLIWPDETYGNFEASLNTAIKKLRRALNDSSERPKFIQTVHRQGYRFIATVTQVTPDTLEAVVPPISESAAEITPKVRRNAFGRPGLQLLASTIAVVLAIFLYLFTHKAEAMNSVAVLPFTNSEPSTEFLSDGITDEIIDYLARSSTARVISRSSSFQFKGKAVDPERIGRELNVRAILTGRIVTAKQEIVVESELIDTRTGARLWAGRYDEPRSGAISPALNVEIGQQVLRKLRIDRGNRLATQSSFPIHNTDAHVLYLRALYHWNKRSDIGLATSELKQVAEMDPNYAPAWALLADCYGFSQHSATDTLPDTKAAIQRALKIDSDLPEAHAALAMTEMYEWNWSGAEKEFQRALELNPNDAGIHYWFAILLRATGQRDREKEEIRLAASLDPVSLWIGIHSGWTDYLAGHDDAAIEDAQKVLELDHRFSEAYRLLGYANLHKRRCAASIEAFRQALSFSPDSASLAGDLGYALGIAGHAAEARRMLTTLERRSETGFVPAGAIAWVYLGLGDKDKFFQIIERAREQRYQWLLYLKIWSVYDSVRGDPRFARLLRQVHLAK